MENNLHKSFEKPNTSQNTFFFTRLNRNLTQVKSYFIHVYCDVYPCNMNVSIRFKLNIFYRQTITGYKNNIQIRDCLARNIDGIRLDIKFLQTLNKQRAKEIDTGIYHIKKIGRIRNNGIQLLIRQISSFGSQQDLLI